MNGFNLRVLYFNCVSGIIQSVQFNFQVNPVSAIANQGSSQTSTARTPPKATAFHPQFQSSTAPQTPPKKSSAAARGVPPPIPPNKPIIPSKSVAARRPDSGESEKKKASAPLKDGEPVRPGQGIEMLGQELADFQQMFVTMATSNNT